MTPVPASPRIRVACYSPYNFWDLHGMWEMTILHSLRLRGAEVRVVACDGQYTDCDVFWSATNRRHELACVECQARVSGLMLNMGMQFEWLGRYLTTEERARARRWTDALSAKELPSAAYENWYVGDWVRSSVHSHLRMSRLDLANHEVERTYRSYVYSGLVACFGLQRFLKESSPDILLLFNGRLSSTRIALELATRRGIRVVCHERGLLRESLYFFDGTHCLSLKPFSDLWRDWGGVPLDHRELERVHAHMADQERGKNIGWRAFSPPPQDPEQIRARLGLRRGRGMWVLFTSSEDEVSAAAEMQGPFCDQRRWIERTVAFVARHPEIDLVIRVHPNIGGERSTGKNAGQLLELEQLRSRLPANAQMVMPDDDVSSYSLMDLATLGLMYHSITGLEMACKGKRVVVGAGAWVRGLPFVYTVREADGYEEMLDRLLDDPTAEQQATIRRMAYRFAYALYFRWNIPFPLVRMPDPHTGRLAYSSLDSLRPGRDPHLDRIAGFLLDGDPVCPMPDVQTRQRSRLEEIAWWERAPGRVPDLKGSRRVIESLAAPALSQERPAGSDSVRLDPGELF